MTDFDKRFKKMSDEFDHDFNHIKRFTIIGAALSTVFSLGILGFFVWVVIVLLQFFGVI